MSSGAGAVSRKKIPEAAPKQAGSETLAVNVQLYMN